MRILQISKFYPPVHGGIEAVARDLSAVFVDAGHEVQVLCANKTLCRVDGHDELGVRITRAASFGLLLSTSMAPGLPWELLRRCRWPEVVHVHMPDPLAALALWLARPRASVVVHWHSDVVRQRVARHLYRPLERWLLRRADAVVATSRAYAESSPLLREVLPKVEVIPIGAPAPLQPAPAQIDAVRLRWGGRRIVFALGRMAHYKGYEVLIEAARALPPDVLVLVGGGGERLPHYRELARARGVAERVHFLGPLTDARVEAHFAAAELFCLASTSRAEAYGVVVLEAMARGKAVVATDIPGSGLGWLHRDGVTGLTVPPDDPPALAAAIRRLLDDPALRQRCGQAGRALWAERLSAQTMGEATLALYRRLLDPGAPATAPTNENGPN